VKIVHWMKKENSGLARSTIEVVKYEALAGHEVCIKQPTEENILYGDDIAEPDIHSIHSQINLKTYHDRKPKIMWMHGEPLSSVGNGISMKAIVDLAPMCDAFICMREEEELIWSSIKRTYRVRKGVDLERYKPLPAGDIPEKLSGEPAVLYVENWRRERNPLYLCVAMELVHRKYPKARLHLYNCGDKRMYETFQALQKNNKWWTFLRSLMGQENDINMLYNRADIVVSCLYPLYARVIEAFGAGKAAICPGYRENGYAYKCDLEPRSMADAIIKCWENYDKVNYRKWAEDHHDVKDSTGEALAVYKRYI